MKTKQHILDLLKETDLPMIRVGDHRFINIWIVVVDDRMFCRQYDFSPNSWYHAFQKNEKGVIKCGDTEFDVVGKIPEDLDKINLRINHAYINKYGDGEYPDTAVQMTEKQHMEKTMELILNLHTRRNRL